MKALIGLAVALAVGLLVMASPPATGYGLWSSLRPVIELTLLLIIPLLFAGAVAELIERTKSQSVGEAHADLETPPEGPLPETQIAHRPGWGAMSPYKRNMILAVGGAGLLAVGSMTVLTPDAWRAAVLIVVGCIAAAISREKRGSVRGEDVAIAVGCAVILITVASIPYS